MQIAELFGIGEATLRRWLRRAQETGSVAPIADYPHGPSPKIEHANLLVLEELMRETPDATNAELAERMEARTGISVSAATISRAVSILGWTRKKAARRQGSRSPAYWASSCALESLAAGGREQPPRLHRRGGLAHRHDPRVRACSHWNADERHRAEEPWNRDHHPRRPDPRRAGGYDDHRGGTDGDVFAVFLDEVLGPHLEDGDLVVMDNAGAHKDPRVKTILPKYGSKPVYLPPYSPELNPIELAWSKLKGFLRTTKARTVPALNEAIGVGMKVITPQDAENWFRHCGYRDGHAT